MHLWEQSSECFSRRPNDNFKEINKPLKELIVLLELYLHVAFAHFQSHVFTFVKKKKDCPKGADSFEFNTYLIAPPKSKNIVKGNHATNKNNHIVTSLTEASPRLTWEKKWNLIWSQRILLTISQWLVERTSGITAVQNVRPGIVQVCISTTYITICAAWLRLLKHIKKSVNIWFKNQMWSQDSPSHTRTTRMSSGQQRTVIRWPPDNLDMLVHDTKGLASKDAVWSVGYMQK